MLRCLPDLRALYEPRAANQAPPIARPQKAPRLKSVSLSRKGAMGRAAGFARAALATHSAGTLQASKLSLAATPKRSSSATKMDMASHWPPRLVRANHLATGISTLM